MANEHVVAKVVRYATERSIWIVEDAPWDRIQRKEAGIEGDGLERGPLKVPLVPHAFNNFYKKGRASAYSFR